MQDKSVTATLCGFASEVNTQALPREVVDRAALLVTDSIGVAIRARKEAESTPALLAAVARMGMDCLLYTSPSPRDGLLSRMPSSA